jgi:uncharacterized protein YfaS (alpha-2-macroglobulin family)
VSPSPDEFLPPNPEIKLTFNQPMDKQSVQLNFLLSGPDGAVYGTYAWNDDITELNFKPEKELTRGVGYTLNVGAGAKSKGGMTLGEDYGTLLQTYNDFDVAETNVNFSTVSFTFSAPLAGGNYQSLVSVTPAVDNLDVNVDESNLYIFGGFIPDTNYAIELSETISDRWGQPLGAPFNLDVHTPSLPPSLYLQSSNSTTAFVRPDEPVLYANIVNIQQTDLTVAPLSLQDFFSLQNSLELQQVFTSADASTFSQTFDSLSSQAAEVKLDLTLENNQLLPGLYYVKISSPQIQSNANNFYFVASSQTNLTFKLGATEALVWAVDLPSQTPVIGAPVALYDDAGNILGSGTTNADGLWQGEVGVHEGQVFAMLGVPGDQNFGLAINNWSNGLEAWNFGYTQRIQPPHTEIYMYTDRPIYPSACQDAQFHLLHKD